MISSGSNAFNLKVKSSDHHLRFLEGNNFFDCNVSTKFGGLQRERSENDRD